MLMPENDELDTRLENLAESLLKKRNEAVEGRASSGIERQWREDQRAFEGIEAAGGKHDMLDFATGEAWIGARRDQAPRRSKVVVNIIRGKCETAEGRFSELQFPTDDKNWGLLTTPVPQSAVAAKPQPPAPAIGQAPQQPAQPPQPMGSLGMIAQGAPAVPQLSEADKLADVKKRCSAMEVVIDDQLEECGFNGESRKVASQSVRLGTGVLKGPNVVKTVNKAWVEQTDSTGSVYVMKAVEELAPASTARDIWDIFPDPHCGSDPKRGAYIWDRDHTLPREVRALIGVKGYNSRQLLRVLAEEPVRTIVQTDKGGNQKSESTSIAKGAPYERWEYHGDVGRDDLEAMGCTCPEDGSSFSACVVFINDRPVKVQLNALDTGDLPYDFFQWVKSDNSPWGIGEPRKLIWQQRIITAAWRAMMDNAGDSAGSMIVIGKDTVPEDGIWEVTGKKIWVDESETGDVGKAFAQYQIGNNQQELQHIIELALKFTDLESGTPALAQGEKGSAPETYGGMKLLMESSDTNRRRLVKQWDDQITRPHIRRYYDWNMQYNERQDIKGDFKVDARGTSVLLVKEQTAESLLQVMQMRADPEVNIQVDWGKTIKQLFQARHLDVLKDDDAIAAARQAQANQPPPEDPRITAAKIMAGAGVQKVQEQGKIDGQLQAEEIQSKLQQSAQEMQHEQNLLQSGQATPHAAAASARIETARINATSKEAIEASRAQAEQSYANTEAQIARDNAAARHQEIMDKRELAILEYSMKNNQTLEQVKADLAKTAMQEQTKRQLAGVDSAITQSEGAHDRTHDMSKHISTIQNDAALRQSELDAAQQQPSQGAQP